MLTVLIIRHGEKPGPEQDGPGLTREGQPDDRSLTVRGWQRAGAWAALFGSGLVPDYPRPDAIYAPGSDRGPEPKRPSRRPLETVVPLAERLGLPILDGWAQGEEAALAATISAGSGVALISWEHKRITASLLPAFLGPSTSKVPARWDPARFDVVLRLDRSSASQPFAFRELFPRLLSGDSDAPL